MSIATIAANVSAALAGVTMATDAASVVKFDALVIFAAGVAVRVRTEDINTGSNLETDGKGRFVAVVDKSKEQRTALVAALVAAGVKDKDAANIASMGRSLAMWIVPLMIEDGSLRDAVSGERMRQIIEETVLYLTHGKDTYNALERLRSNKWEMLPVAEAAPEADAKEGPVAVDPDLSATLEGPTEASAEGASEPTDPASVLDAEVSNALRVLSAALERGDVERIAAHNGGSVAVSLMAALTAFNEARQAEAAEETAKALEAKAEKARNRKSA